jgi:hypothetical protein
MPFGKLSQHVTDVRSPPLLAREGRIVLSGEEVDGDPGRDEPAHFLKTVTKGVVEGLRQAS